MKILHVNKFQYRAGGAEGYMLDVAALQERRGAAIEFFGMDHPENPPLTYDEHFPSYVQLDPPPAGALGKARTGARMFWSPSSARGIAAVVERFRPDVAHLHNVYHQLSPSILRPLARHGVPTVMTLHDYKLACPSYRFLDQDGICEACMGRRFHQAAVRRCKDGSLVSSALLGLELATHTYLGSYRPVQLFVCPSRFMADKMTEAGVFPDRMRHLPHFVETDGVATKTEPGGPVLFAGRLSHEKGIDTLLRAAARLGPATPVDIAGGGPELPALEKLVAELGLTEVRFLGHLAKDELERRILAASAVVVPSRWYENQPMTILEAFAAGVPVIGTALGGIPELIDDGVDGLVVPAEDLPAFAAAIGRILADPADAMRMGAAARRKVEASFSATVHHDGLLALYDEAAGLAPAAR